MADPQPKNTAEIPPYYDRYQVEREKRYESELHRVEDAIERNGKRIDELKDDTKHQITDLKEDMNRRFEDVDHRFESLETRMERRFDEQAKWFKYTFGTIVFGFLAILIKLFLG